MPDPKRNPDDNRDDSMGSGERQAPGRPGSDEQHGDQRRDQDRKDPQKQGGQQPGGPRPNQGR
jgi:hypothetical protein